MTKRQSFLATLKKVLDYSLNSDTILLAILATFVIGFGIVGFINSKQVPIPLTENEIEYYTSQAEVGYLKGLCYLDDNVKLIPINDTTFYVCSSSQSVKKQKLNVTFSENSISNTEVYYSANFTALYTVSGVALGFLLCILFTFLMEYISSRIQISTKCDRPLNFSDEDK